MMAFLSDWINLTPGQLLVKYWWLWTVIAAGGIGMSEFNRRRDAK